MRFKLDENMPAGLVGDLSSAGHDTATCKEEKLAGSVDAAVASHAAAEGRILVTFDLDFADIRRQPPAGHPGVLVFRLHSQDRETCRRAFERLLAAVPESDFQDSLIIVEDARVRIRRPPSTP